MRKTILSFVSLSLLVGCSDYEKERKLIRELKEKQSFSEVQANIPDNCKLSYAGTVYLKESIDPSRIFYVTCGDKVTISESHEVSRGKYKDTQSDITILEKSE